MSCLAGPQPPNNGGEECYHAILNGGSSWLLPYPVSTGDVITVSNANGAAFDGGSAWNCPDGSVFFA